MIFSGIHKFNKMSLKDGLLAIWPALAVLFATLIISVFINEFTYITGVKELWKVFLRFFRLLIILVLPLLLLPVVFTGINFLLNRGNGRLVHLQDYALPSSKILIIRPLQGIALVMLIASKLITVLQLYTHTIDNSSILPPFQFDPWRLVVVTLIVAVTSMLLSTLWTMDDLGIRYFNRQTKEIKMAGKYLGVLLPVIFGFYGVISLLENYAFQSAVQYIVEMAVIFYPPFVIFAVMHNRYILKRQSLLLKKLGAGPYEISMNEIRIDM
jgi:hypothetical protein